MLGEDFHTSASVVAIKMLSTTHSTDIYTFCKSSACVPCSMILPDSMTSAVRTKTRAAYSFIPSQGKQLQKTAQRCTYVSRGAMIRFAFMIVDSRWAMAITVRPFISDSSAFCT